MGRCDVVSHPTTVMLKSEAALNFQVLPSLSGYHQNVLRQPGPAASKELRRTHVVQHVNPNKVLVVKKMSHEV